MTWLTSFKSIPRIPGSLGLVVSLLWLLTVSFTFFAPTQVMTNAISLFCVLVFHGDLHNLDTEAAASSNVQRYGEPVTVRDGQTMGAWVLPRSHLQRSCGSLSRLWCSFLWVLNALSKLRRFPHNFGIMKTQGLWFLSSLKGFSAMHFVEKESLESPSSFRKAQCIFLAPRAACRSLGSTTMPPQTAEANFDESAPSLK